MKKLIMLFITTVFATITYIVCLEIPTLDVNILRVGIVDMNKVLQEHPSIEKIKQEISSINQNKLVEITNLEKEIEELIKQKLSLITEIEQVKTQLQKLSLPISSEPVSTDNIYSSSDTDKSTSTVSIQSQTVQIEQQIQQLKSDIELKEKNLAQIEQTISEKKQQIKQKQQEMTDKTEEIKQKMEMQLYAELYQIIQQVAQEEHLNIVIDKSGILYGEGHIDITEKILKKLIQQKR